MCVCWPSRHGACDQLTIAFAVRRHSHDPIVRHSEARQYPGSFGLRMRTRPGIHTVPAHTRQAASLSLQLLDIIGRKKQLNSVSNGGDESKGPLDTVLPLHALSLSLTLTGELLSDGSSFLSEARSFSQSCQTSLWIRMQLYMYHDVRGLQLWACSSVQRACRRSNSSSRRSLNEANVGGR